MKTYLEMFKEMKEIFSDPSKRIMGAYGIAAEGGSTWGNNPAAICWCLVGVMAKIENDAIPSDNFATRLARHLPENLPSKLDKKADHSSISMLIFFNDGSHSYNITPATHEEVMALIDRAIQFEEKQEKEIIQLDSFGRNV